MATMRGKQGTSPDARVDALVARAEESGRRRDGGPARGGLRYVFYGGSRPRAGRTLSHRGRGSRSRPGRWSAATG